MPRVLRFGLVVLLLDCPALAGQDNAAVDLRAATTGVGVELAKLLSGHFGARLGASYYSWSTNKSQSDISYDASLKLHTFTALFDLFPGRRGSFHLTTGLVTNPLTISATGIPSASDTFKINGTKYSASQVGTLTAAGKFHGVSPYLGFGWGTAANDHKALKFLFDLGAALGKPSITLNATGADSIPQLAADIQAQQAKTQHDVRKFLKAYPILAFGLGYRF